MTNKISRKILLVLALMIISLPAFVSCNKDKDDDDTFYYSTSTLTTLVRNFSLQANTEVLASLDSVHFTIDYDNGLIYNADSLPKGTDVSALKVKVEFLNTVHSADFIVTDATKQSDTTIHYTASMNTSIDFTGKTLLRVTSDDETRVKDYEIKVLVHQVNPDSLVWPESWRRDLPGYQYNATAHKAVKLGDRYLIMNYNGSEARLLTASAPNQATWDNQLLDLPFIPAVPSLVATADALYMLDADGALYTSGNGIAWTSCGVTWHSIVGAYEGRVLGIMNGDGGYYHDEYPRAQGFTTSRVEDGFPVDHASNMVMTENTWTVSQQAFIMGGMDSQGRLQNTVWGYDGTRWGKISNSGASVLPAMADATLFPYYTYRTLKGVRRYAKQLTWFIMGGRLANGTLNGTIYLSNTQGVNWTKGDSTFTQPDYMTRFYGAQAFVASETLTAGTGGRNMPRRVQSLVTSWECPYVYLFGGYNDQGALLPFVWRGVYNRLTHYPVY